MQDIKRLQRTSRINVSIFDICPRANYTSFNCSMEKNRVIFETCVFKTAQTRLVLISRKWIVNAGHESSWSIERLQNTRIASIGMYVRMNIIDSLMRLIGIPKEQSVAIS